MKKILFSAFGLFSCLISYAQDPDVTGSTIVGTVSPTDSPFANGETVSFSIIAGANSGQLAWPAPAGQPFTINIVTGRIKNPVVTFTNPNYFDVVITPGNTTVNSKTYTITLTQNQSIPEFEATVFTITGVAEGTDGQTVRYQANGNPGGYNSTNVGQDNPSSSGVIQGALPVTLISFMARTEGAMSQLNWSTTAETNSNYFEVQRSRNGKDWDKIGRTEASGESSVLVGYSYTDLSPLKGNNYYRLRMVDKDETFAYSRIRNVEFTTAVKAVLYPNPTTDKFTLDVDDLSKIQRIQLHDVSGKLVYESTKPTSSDISADVYVKYLPSGIYVVRVTRTDATIDLLKIVKQ